MRQICAPVRQRRARERVAEDDDALGFRRAAGWRNSASWKPSEFRRKLKNFRPGSSSAPLADVADRRRSRARQSARDASDRARTMAVAPRARGARARRTSDTTISAPTLAIAASEVDAMERSSSAPRASAERCAFHRRARRRAAPSGPGSDRFTGRSAWRVRRRGSNNHVERSFTSPTAEMLRARKRRASRRMPPCSGRRLPGPGPWLRAAHGRPRRRDCRRRLVHGRDATASGRR
jgi:hypothetical protein